MLTLCSFCSKAQAPVDSTVMLFDSLTVLYKVKIGVVNAANAALNIRKLEHDEKEALGIFITAKSVGVFDLFLKLKDSWISIVDSESYEPHHFVASIEEGKFKDKSKLSFFQAEDVVGLQKYDFGYSEWSDTLFYDAPDQVFDVVSALFKLRSFDFDGIEIGQSIGSNVFFEGRLFRLNLFYKGKDLIRTKYGDIPCYLLEPEVPTNNHFKTSNAVKIWFSADNKRIPVRILANMKAGKVDIILKRIVKNK